MANKKEKNKNGFTLAELLVGIGIFSILIGSIISILISGIEVQRRLLAQQEMLNQLSYVIEFMGRALRMARTEDGSFNCLSSNFNYENSGGISGIKFINHIDSDKCQSFYLENTTLKFDSDINDPDPATEFALTSPKIEVQELRFQIFGGDSGSPQARTTVFLKANHVNVSSVINLQTTISQRNLNE